MSYEYFTIDSYQVQSFNRFKQIPATIQYHRPRGTCTVITTITINEMIKEIKSAIANQEEVLIDVPAPDHLISVVMEVQRTRKRDGTIFMVLNGFHEGQALGGISLDTHPDLLAEHLIHAIVNGSELMIHIRN